MKLLYVSYLGVEYLNFFFWGKEEDGGLFYLFCWVGVGGENFMVEGLFFIIRVYLFCIKVFFFYYLDCFIFFFYLG